MITPYNIAPDFVRKFRAGPSILDLFGKCRRAWALRYIAGHDSYNVTWASVRDHVYDKSLRMYVPPGGGHGPAIAPRQRSTALGTEAHRIVESHYLGRAVAADWTTFPGQVAQAWLDVMPGPESCTEIRTETAISLDPPSDMDWNKTPVLEGTSDLLLRLADVWVSSRLGPWLVGDWKTTRSFQYAKTAAELYTNSQGILYPLAAMRRLGLDSIPCRWAYSITDPARRREARATDFVQTREHAEAAARPLFQAAAEMRAIYDAVAHMEPLAAALSVPATGAPSACEAFGGCPHSVERGGACTAPLEMTTGQRMLAERTATAKTCAPAPAVVPLEALLQRSIDQTRKAGYMSPFQKRLQELQQAQATSAPPATTCDADTGEVLNPQPDAPVSVAETADVLSAPVLGQAQTVVATVTPAVADPFSDRAMAAALVYNNPPIKRGPGRPRGSRNKAPAAIAAVTVPMGDVSETEDDPDDIRLDPEEPAKFRDLVDHPPQPTPALIEAIKQSRPETLTRYHINLAADRPSGGWVADVVELPGCVTQGATLAQTRDRVREAIQAFLDLEEPFAGELVDVTNILDGVTPTTADPDITLSQLAAAAKAHGCRIEVRFDGLKEKANG